MQVRFSTPVSFDTLHNGFVGDGVPAIPSNATNCGGGVFVSPTGELWERFDGRGTTEKSCVYYWPSVAMCPRAYAKAIEVPKVF